MFSENKFGTTFSLLIIIVIATTSCRCQFPKYISSDVLQSNCDGLIVVIDALILNSDAAEYYFVIDHHFLGDLGEALKNIVSRASAFIRVIIYDEETVDIWMSDTVLPLQSDATRTVILLLEESLVEHIFNMLAENDLESWRTNWLVFGYPGTAPILENILREGVQVLVAESNTNNSCNDHFSLLRTYVTKENVVKFQGLGNISTNYTFSSKIQLLPSLVRSYDNFNGRSLVTTVIDNWPFIGLEFIGNQIKLSSGIDFNILETLSQKLNFSYTAVIPDDLQWGVVLPNGTITGSVGMVNARQAHLTINELTITELREQVVDFTYLYYMESTKLVGLAPGRRNQAWQTFLPFTIEVWIMLVAATIMAGIINSIFYNIPNFDKSKKTSIALKDFTFEALRILARQESRLKVNSWPTRMVALSWCFFCFICQAFYSTSLIAFLTIPTMEKAVDTLSDLLKAQEKGQHQLILNIGTSNDELFKEATFGIYESLYQNFNPDTGYVTRREKGIEKVMYDKGIFVNAHLNSEILVTNLGREYFHLGSQSFYHQSYGIICPKGSAYRQVFNKILIRLTDSGLIYKWSQDVIDDVSRKNSAQQNDGNHNPKKQKAKGPESLTIKNLQGAFIVMLIGLSVSLIVFLIELLYRK